MSTFWFFIFATMLYYGVELAPRRYRLPLSSIPVIGIGSVFLWADWNDGAPGPFGYAGIFFLLFGGGLGLLALRKPSTEEVTPETDEPLVVPARLVTGWWTRGWTKGYLTLDGTCLRFLTETEQIEFEVDLRRGYGVSFPFLQQAEMRIESDAQQHRVSFGHAMPGLGEARDTKRFWRQAIDRRTHH